MYLVVLIPVSCFVKCEIHHEQTLTYRCFWYCYCLFLSMLIVLICELDIAFGYFVPCNVTQGLSNADFCLGKIIHLLWTGNIFVVDSKFFLLFSVILNKDGCITLLAVTICLSVCPKKLACSVFELTILSVSHKLPLKLLMLSGTSTVIWCDTTNLGKEM